MIIPGKTYCQIKDEKILRLVVTEPSAFEGFCYYYLLVIEIRNLKISENYKNNFILAITKHIQEYNFCTLNKNSF